MNFILMRNYIAMKTYIIFLDKMFLHTYQKNIEKNGIQNPNHDFLLVTVK